MTDTRGDRQREHQSCLSLCGISSSPVGGVGHVDIPHPLSQNPFILVLLSPLSFPMQKNKGVAIQRHTGVFVNVHSHTNIHRHTQSNMELYKWERHQKIPPSLSSVLAFYSCVYANVLFVCLCSIHLISGPQPFRPTHILTSRMRFV